MTDNEITKQIRNLYWKDEKNNFISIWILIIALIVSLLIGIFMNPLYLFISGVTLIGFIEIFFKKRKIMKKEITLSEKIDFLIQEKNTLENKLFKNEKLQEKYEKLRELEKEKDELLNNVKGVDELINNISV